MKQVVVGIVRGSKGYPFLQRMDRTWTFPSGKVESTDADIDAALVREIFQETGLHVVPVFNLGSRIDGDKEIFYKVCQYLDGDLELKEKDKFLSVAWKSAEAILQTAEGHFYAPVEEYLRGHTSRAIQTVPVAQPAPTV